MSDGVKFEFSAQELAKIRKKYTLIAERLHNTDPALLRAGSAALGEARRRIQSGGDGAWKPNIAGNPLLWREGTLIRSLQLGGTGNISSITGNSIQTGTNLPYAIMMQEGTGVYGPTHSPIVPTNAKVLAFDINGQTVFARSVQGSPPRPFLYFDEPLKETIRKVLYKAFFALAEVVEFE